ncbi:hypothetical protein H1R20_g6433, partial [Candolleomyces eurysporus]
MNRTKLVSALMTLGVMLLCASVELTLVLTIRPMQNHRSKEIATSFFGIASCVLISVALIPQYYEIYKLKAVVGISLLFLAVDITGGVFNDLSLVFAERFDVLAAVSYSLVIVLDSVIIVCAAAFKLSAWRRRRRRGGSSIHGAAPNDEIPQPDGGSGGDDEVPLQHLTILSRTGSMLSRTPSRYSWIVTDVDDVRHARAGCAQGLEEGEKSLKGNHHEEIAEVGVKGERV